jgi:hypothetical protein
MSHQVTVTLTDEEYAALTAEAERSGTPIEAIVHNKLAGNSIAPGASHLAMTGQEFLEWLYRTGKVLNMPTREPLTQEEEAERERLAALFGQGKPVSEMVIEDRGPY